jgi:hypothetical protein
MFDILKLVRPIKLRLAEKALLYVLADRANASGESWASREQLKDDTGASTRTLSRAIESLSSRAFISVSRRYNKSNLYRVNAAVLQAINDARVAGLVGNGARVASRDQVDGATVARQWCQSGSLSSKEPVMAPPRAPNAISHEAGSSQGTAANSRQPVLYNNHLQQQAVEVKNDKTSTIEMDNSPSHSDAPTHNRPSAPRRPMWLEEGEEIPLEIPF